MKPLQYKYILKTNLFRYFTSTFSTISRVESIIWDLYYSKKISASVMSIIFFFFLCIWIRSRVILSFISDVHRSNNSKQCRRSILCIYVYIVYIYIYNSLNHHVSTNSYYLLPLQWRRKAVRKKRIQSKIHRRVPNWHFVCFERNSNLTYYYYCLDSYTVSLWSHTREHV